MTCLLIVGIDGARTGHRASLAATQLVRASMCLMPQAVQLSFAVSHSSNRSARAEPPVNESST